MFKSVSSVVMLVLAAGSVCAGQQPDKPVADKPAADKPVAPQPAAARPVAAQPGTAQPGKQMSRTPWAVTVIHKVDLNKLIERIQKRGVRVGLIGTTMQDPLNITTGLVVDGDGHVLTRL